MSENRPVLYMICGKIAAGKSTVAHRLAAENNALILSEDQWLATLYKDMLQTPKDYVKYAARLRAAMGPHIVALLNAHMSVVLDFPANTAANRQWMARILQQSNAQHELHVLDVPDDICLSRLHARNASGTHEFHATETQFRQFAKFYEPPRIEEGFNLILHKA